jgi:hypothetical protein
MLLIQLAALFFNVTLSIVLVKLGYGIVGIAVGTSVAFIFYKIFLTNLSLKFLEIKKRDRFVIALQLGAPFTYILFSVTVILKIAGLETATSVKEILLKVISYSVVCLPLLFVLLSNMKKEGLLFGCRLCRRTP